MLRVQRVRKEFLAARVASMVRDSRLVAVAHAGNLSIDERKEVRATLLGAGAQLTYTKNSVACKGLEAAGAGGLAPLMRGPTLLTSSSDEVPLAAALLSLSKQLPSNFFVLGALLGRRRILQEAEVARLAALPSAEQVHSELVSSMLPGTALQVPNVAAYLVGVLQQRVGMLEGEGGGGGGGDADAAGKPP